MGTYTYIYTTGLIGKLKVKNPKNLSMHIYYMHATYTAAGYHKTRKKKATDRAPSLRDKTHFTGTLK